MSQSFIILLLILILKNTLTQNSIIIANYKRNFKEYIYWSTFRWRWPFPVIGLGLIQFASAEDYLNDFMIDRFDIIMRRIFATFILWLLISSIFVFVDGIFF